MVYSSSRLLVKNKAQSSWEPCAVCTTNSYLSPDNHSSILWCTGYSGFREAKIGRPSYIPDPVRMFGKRGKAIKPPIPTSVFPHLDGVVTSSRGKLLNGWRNFTNQRARSSCRCPRDWCHSHRMCRVNLGFLPCSISLLCQNRNGAVWWTTCQAQPKLMWSPAYAVHGRIVLLENLLMLRIHTRMIQMLFHFHWANKWRELITGFSTGFFSAWAISQNDAGMKSLEEKKERGSATYSPGLGSTRCQLPASRWWPSCRRSRKQGWIQT